MQDKKEVSIDQLHALWMRIWELIRAHLFTLDGNEVQAAIRAYNDPKHPFWAKLGEALSELRHKLELAERERSEYHIMPTGAHRPNTDVLEDLASKAADIHFDIDLAAVTAAIPPFEVSWNEGVTIGFLDCNQKLRAADAYLAAETRGYKLAPPSLAVRFLADYCVRFKDQEFMSFTGCGSYPILFIDPDQLERSLVIEQSPKHEYRRILSRASLAKQHHLIAIIKQK